MRPKPVVAGAQDSYRKPEQQSVIEDGVVHTYPVGALLGEYYGWPVTLIGALLACLTALVIATFATVGTFRVARMRPRPSH